MNSLRDTACEYAMDRKWHIFPVYPRMKQPHGGLVPKGYNEASSYGPDILYWWEREPKANIGLACRKSGLVVLDVDPRNGGDDSLFELERKIGGLPRTLSAKTATGGEHYFFNDGGVIDDYKREVAPGIDIKSNGYVLLAPSIRYMGAYAWDDLAAVAPICPYWLEHMVQAAPQRKDRGVLEPSASPLLSIPADQYAPALTGRDVDSGGWMQCPFHKDGMERTPSFKVQGTMWACFACEPMMGKQTMGGNILDLAGMLWNYAMPLTGADLQEVKARCEATFYSILVAKVAVRK